MINEVLDRSKILKIHPSDNVLVALADLSAGDIIHHENGEVVLRSDVKAKHKFVYQNFEIGDIIYMYGVVVGRASKNIHAGTPITVDNVTHTTQKDIRKRSSPSWQPKINNKWEEAHFMGYAREDGQVGTANYWLVFPLVFCENKYIEVLKDAINDALGHNKYHKYRKYARELLTGSPSPIKEEVRNQGIENKLFPNIDGVRFITHQMGCGGTRQDAQALCGLLAGYLTNPNVAGATVLSLGCQNAQFAILEEEIEKRDHNFSKPISYFNQQTIGNEDDFISEAISSIIAGIKKANEINRTKHPISKLNIGLECGGSDGFSGISANPVLGYVSDVMAAVKGTAILSEFPELCGVEQELVDRCIDNADADRFLDLMHRYEFAAVSSGSSFDMNPSPGNIKDGLITDAMKSAGAAKKGGTSPVTQVLDYPEKSQKSGLNLLCTPGNDVESTTALAAAGCNIILFTTGLGTPTGNPIVPVLKVSSNTQLAKKMMDIIDFDTGSIINGEATISQLGDSLMELIISIASGQKMCKAMINEQFDFIPWKRGVSL
jgi:altronate hydrolase